MKTKFYAILAVLMILGALITIQAIAQEKKSPDQKQSNEQEMMAAYMKYATPGPEHKALQPLVGSWDCATKMWMDPTAPASESKGSAEIKWILGNRFIQEDDAGEMNGMPFHGMGITGYDLYKKQYNWIWMDELSTMILYNSGSADSTGKVFTYSGNYTDVATGQPKTFKVVIQIVDDNKHTFTMYDQTPDGKLVKNIEIVYTRKK